VSSRDDTDRPEIVPMGTFQLSSTVGASVLVAVWLLLACSKMVPVSCGYCSGTSLPSSHLTVYQLEK